MPDLSSTGQDERARKSPLYRYFLAERAEILRHKWIESEKAGRDIGLETALLEWSSQHRKRWRELSQEAGRCLSAVGARAGGE